MRIAGKRSKFVNTRWRCELNHKWTAIAKFNHYTAMEFSVGQEVICAEETKGESGQLLVSRLRAAD